MAMQLYEPPKEPVQLLQSPSVIDILKEQVKKIEKLLEDVAAGTANETTFNDLHCALNIVNDIILSLDYAKDFYHIGGFPLLIPLLSCGNAGIIAATAELVADLCQNNSFCQSMALDFDVFPKLVELLKDHSDIKVRSKALYAISSLCRHNKNVMEGSELTDIIPVLIRQLEDERLRARTAFFLSYLSNYESFRETLFKADLIGVVINLLKDNDDLSTEHLLSILRHQVAMHVQSRHQCQEEKYNLKEILQSKIDFYDSKGEYEEAKEHCDNILALCFPYVKK